MSNLSYLLCERHGVMIIKYNISSIPFSSQEWKSITQYVILSSGMWSRQLVPYRVSLSTNRFCHVFAHEFRGNTLYSCIIENAPQNLCNTNLMLFAYDFFYKFMSLHSDPITSFLKEVTTIKDINSKEGTFSDSIGNDEDDMWDNLLIEYDLKDNIMTFEETTLFNTLPNITNSLKSIFSPLEDYLRRINNNNNKNSSSSSFSSSSQNTTTIELDPYQSICIAIYHLSIVKDEDYSNYPHSEGGNEQSILTCLTTWNDHWMKSYFGGSVDSWYDQLIWRKLIVTHAMGILDEQSKNGLMISRIKTGVVMVLFTAGSVENQYSPQQQILLLNNDQLKGAFQQSVQKLKEWFRG